MRAAWLLVWVTLLFGINTIVGSLPAEAQNSVERDSRDFDNDRDDEDDDEGEQRPTPRQYTPGRYGQENPALNPYAAEIFESRDARTDKFRIFGTFWLAGVYDDSRMNDTHNGFWVRSEDPRGQGADRASNLSGAEARTVAPESNDSTFSLHHRLISFGLALEGAPIRELAATIGGLLEMDFHNTTNSGSPVASRPAVRMRLGYLWLNWQDEFILSVGQREDLIAPYLPSVNQEWALWGAGNLGDWRPQIRFEFVPILGRDGNRLFFQTMVGLTGAIDGQDLDSGTFAGTLDGEASGVPTIQFRMGFDLRMVDPDLRVVLGLFFHRAWERTDAAVGDVGGASGVQADRERQNFNSYAFGFDILVELDLDGIGKFRLTGEGFYGRNLSDVRGGILHGVNANQARGVLSNGGWVELTFEPIWWFAVTVGASLDDPRNDDVNFGTTSGLRTGRTYNQTIYGAVRFKLGAFQVGLDYIHWRTNFFHWSNGIDNRVYLSFSYSFTHGD